MIAKADSCCANTSTKPAERRALRFALAGNPNSGKTTLFNALTGLRAHTASYPGTTIECRLGRCANGAVGIELLDLPGIYDFNASSEEEQVALDALQGRSAEFGAPDGVIVVTDATNLNRSLFLTSQIVEMKLPVVVALNMVDLAEARGIRVDAARLAAELGCPVVPGVARTGRGLAELRAARANSIAGRLGRCIEPVLRRRGFDWQIDIGITISFAAREVIVSTLAVVYGVGRGRGGGKPRLALRLAAPREDLLHYNAGLSAIYCVNDRLHFMLESAGNWNDEVGASRQLALVVSPAVRHAVNFKNDSQLVLGVGVPVGLTRQAPDLGVFLYVSFEHFLPGAKRK